MGKLDGVVRRRESFKVKDEEINTLCQENGIDPSAIEEAYKITSLVARRKKIDELLGGDKRVWIKRWFFYEDPAVRAERLATTKKLDKRDDIAAEITLLSDDLKALGVVLRGAMEDPDIQKAQEAIMRGHKPEESSLAGHTSFRELRTIMPTDDDFDAEWKKYKAAVPGGYDGKTDPEKQDITNRFAQEQRDKRMKNKKGIWASIVDSMVQAYYESKKGASGFYA
jgi:hypothetical protein